MKPLMKTAPVFVAMFLTYASPCMAGDNTVGGTAAGQDLSTGTNNTIIGTEAGVEVTTGTDNTLLGYESGFGVSGNHNIIVGEDPSSAITTGSSNILVGNSLTEVTNSSSNQLDIGDTLYGTLGGGGTLTAANNFTALGTIIGNLFSGSGASLTSLNGSNISSGTVGAARLPAGTVITTTASPAQGDILYYNGSNWVDLPAGTSGQFFETQGASANPKWAAGVGSGSISSGTQYQLGYYATTGTSISGDSNLTTDSSNDLNIVSSSAALEIGSNKILSLPDSSTANIAVGYDSLLNDTSAVNNTAVGAYAMNGTSASPMTGTANNTAVGYTAMYSLKSTAANNSVVGNAAAYYMSTGSENTALGSNAMEGASASLLTGDYNVAVGYSAMTNLQGTAEYNTALGATAGNGLTTGTDDTVIGYQAGYDLTTGTDNTLLGYQAGIAVTGNYNIMVGEDPSHAITSGSSNILIGNSLTKVTNSSSNQIDIGDVIVATGSGTPSTSSTTVEGALTVSGAGTIDGALTVDGAGTIDGTLTVEGADLNISTASASLEIGSNSILSLPDSSTANIAVGYQALLNDTTALNNTALGAYAMHGTSASPMTGTANNTAVGYTAMYSLKSTAANNSVVGNAAGYYMSTGSENTAFGSNAMEGASASLLTGDYNTAVGYQAMQGLQGTADDDTVIGYQAGYDLTTGTDNTLLGYQAGIAVTGNYNIMVGEDPSHAITSGSSNILVGNSLTKVTNSSNNQIDIGDVIVVTGSGTPSTSSTTIEGTLTVDGSVTLSGIGTSTTGDYVCANGSTIGKGTTCTLSDENAKQDIVLLTDALAEVEKFQPVQFRYKKGFGYDDTTLHVGFTAQRMAKVDPRVVVYDKGSPHAVAYENITAINSAAIQEQQKEIDELKAELKTLREQQPK